MILPNPPVLIDDNIFFMATTEVLQTDLGIKWLSGFKSNFESFLKSRSLELRPNAVLMITVIAN
jgi:hypothetical protein